MKITTSRGKTLEVDVAMMSGTTGRMIIRLDDDRPLSEIAADFDLLESILSERDKEKITYHGPFALSGIKRYNPNDKVSITLEKEV